MVVHHHRQVVGREAIGFEQDLIVYLGVLKDGVAAHHVVDNGLAGERHFEADDMWFVGRDRAGWQVAAVAVVHRCLFAGALFGAYLRQPLRRAVTAVGPAVSKQFLGHLAIELQAVRLDIRTIRPTDGVASGIF